MFNRRQNKIVFFGIYFVLLVTHTRNMVHWQSNKVLIVLFGISSLHFDLIRSDCSAAGAERSEICTNIDAIDRRQIDDYRSQSKDTRDLWRDDSERQRTGQFHFVFLRYLGSRPNPNRKY